MRSEINRLGSYADYGRQFASFYDDLFPPGAITDRETSWLLGFVPEDAATIVELGAGTGRVALPLASALARRPHAPRYVAVDFSQEMLDRLALKDTASKITGVLGDMSRLDYPDDVDVIVCVCGTISMLTDSAHQTETFRRAANALRPAGVFVVETHDEELVRAMHSQPQITYAIPYPGKNRALLTFSRLEGDQWNLEHIWIDDGTASFPREASRLTSLRELDGYAAAAGLEVVSHTRGLDGADLTTSGPTVTAVYRKPAE